jgi:iron complex outermembrane receptor protein
MVCASTIALFASAPVLAQQEAPVPGGEDSSQNADPVAAAPRAEGAQADSVPDIVVTGTSIRGVAPVGSSLIAVGRSDIEQSPASTTARLLLETPQITNTGVTDSSRNGNGGASNISYGSSINLRGIGPYATLTLLNGRRAVGQSPNAATPDPSTIPTIALERVEIIADGASAIYGSDAVAGVANLIFRRRYEGLQAQFRQGFGDHYNEAQISAFGGHGWSSGRFTLSFQHAYRSRLNGVDRDFFSADLTGQGGGDYRVPLCNPGNILIGDTSYAIPAGGATPTNLVAGTTNMCNPYKQQDILPQQEENSGTFTFDQDITDKIHLFADGYVARRDGSRYSAAPNQAITVPSSNAFFVSPLGATLPACKASAGAPAGSTCETVNYDFAEAFGGPAYTTFYSFSWEGSAGLNIDLPAGFELTGYGTIGRNHDHVLSHGTNLDSAALTAALASSDPATAFNPFGTGPNSGAVTDALFNNYTTTNGVTNMHAAEVKVDGPLFKLPGGDARIAIGGDYYQVHTLTGQVKGPLDNQTGNLADLRRHVWSTYGELFIPIFGEGNALPGLQKLDLDLAGRIDWYSDVGSTKNPKIGINWSPVRHVTVHGSYGTSFRAPLLTQIVSGGGPQLYFQNYYDPTANGGQGGVIQGIAVNSGVGNTVPKPETARTYSLGVDFTPSSPRGATFSLNYFDLVYKGQIVGYLSNLNVLRQESLFAPIILRGQAARDRIAELVAMGLPVNRGTVENALTTDVFVNGASMNQGTTIARGLDFTAVMPFDLGRAGNLRVGVKGTRYLAYKVAFTPGGEVVSELNNIDYPLRWRGRGSVNWTLDGIDAAVFVNYQNGFDNPNSETAPHVAANTTVDLSLSYSFGDNYTDGRKNLKLGLDVTNLFDRDPPFVDIAPGNNGGGGFDPQTSSPIGRVVYLSLSKSF